jgi:hypothetical protein
VCHYHNIRSIFILGVTFSLGESTGSDLFIHRSESVSSRVTFMRWPIFIVLGLSVCYILIRVQVGRYILEPTVHLLSVRDLGATLSSLINQELLKCSLLLCIQISHLVISMELLITDSLGQLGWFHIVLPCFPGFVYRFP